MPRRRASRGRVTTALAMGLSLASLGMLPAVAVAAASDLAPPTLEVAAPPPAGGALPDLGLPRQPLLRIAEAQPLMLDPQLGRWSFPEDGIARWELRLSTPDATFLGAVLQQPELPEGSRVWLISDQGQGVRGPYSAPQGADGQLWLPLLRGRSAVLRVELPAASLNALRLGATELHYGTVDLFGGLLGRTQARVGESGGCQNNVACPLGDPWRAQIRSTVRITIGNQVLCSAQIVNNTRNDNTPLLLTADHCGLGGGRFDPASLVTLFDFESSQCEVDIGFTGTRSVEGGELLYRDTLSDTSLVRLPRLPSGGNVFLAGWDASGRGAQSGAGIHHPSGDLKKISIFDSATERERVDIVGAELGARQTVESWRMVWAEGTTEPGSSGSGLFNEAQRIIGVLSGGQSACAAEPVPVVGALLPQPEDNPGPDFYGRLEVAFDREGELGTPLRAFLAPGSGSAAVGGRNIGGRTTPAAGSDGGGGNGGGGFGLAALLLLLGMTRLRIPHRAPR